MKFTEEEITAAKATRNGIIEKDIPELKAIYMAGEIVMWDELNNRVIEKKEWNSERIIGRVRERHAELKENYNFDYNSFFNGWQEGRVDMLVQILEHPEREIDQQNVLDALRFVWRNLNFIKSKLEKEEVNTPSYYRLNPRVISMLEKIDQALNEFKTKEK